MDGLTVRQKHNTQEAILHLRHLHPAPNSAISLDGFAKRLPDGLFNPLLSDESPIGPATDCLKVACDFHLANVADSPFVCLFCRLSKYPPAKPGALCCEPLKAAGGVANATPV